MENGQKIKAEDNDATKDAADEVDPSKVKNATPIAGNIKEKIEEKEEVDVKKEVESQEIKSEKESKIKEEVDVKKEKDEDTNNAKVGVKEEKPSAELLKKIQEQIEYYFGNVNMHKDKFLIEQTKLDEGWIPMTTMLNFKQLTNLSKSIDVILSALESSDLMEISKDRKKIRRSLEHPLPEYNEEYRKAQEARTVYVKGFPQTDMNIEKLKVFFTPYKPFETIIMRKYQDKEKVLKFKGSVFVQFQTMDAAKCFMAKESVKFNDVELIRKWAADYAVEKAQEKEERRKKKPDNKLKKAAGSDAKEDKEDDADSTSPREITLPRGAVIYFSGVSKTCLREEIKECLEELDAEVAYIDFHRGNTEGYIRLQGENTAKPVLEKMNGDKMTIQDLEVTFRILEGEEEENYLVKVVESMAASKNKHNKGKRSGKKGRNARSGRKRGNSPARDAVSAKKVKVEAE